MSHPQPPQRQPTPNETERYAKAVHNAALVALVACPVLALLPPRKLDIYTLGLVGVTGYSANYLVRESSGRSVWQHVSGQQRRAQQLPSTTAPMQPSVAGELQRQGRAEVEGRVLQSSRESWKMQRQKEIREDVEEGKGFGEMIMDQIWEVWNQGKTEEEEEHDG